MNIQWYFINAVAFSEKINILHGCVNKLLYSTIIKNYGGETHDRTTHVYYAVYK